MSEGDGFKVRDRRRFDEDGNAREDAEPTADAEPVVVSEPLGDLPAIDFSTFILSLSTSAVVHLGQAPRPDGSVVKELALARQTIDILGMLHEKTRSNLTDDEERLLVDVLYDLRLRFVEATG